MRGEWIEMRTNDKCKRGVMSLPMRGEWIEIVLSEGGVNYDVQVSPHAGRVD